MRPGGFSGRPVRRGGAPGGYAHAYPGLAVERTSWIPTSHRRSSAALRLPLAGPALRITSGEPLVRRAERGVGGQHDDDDRGDLEEAPELDVVSEHDVDRLEDDELAE